MDESIGQAFFEGSFLNVHIHTKYIEDFALEVSVGRLNANASVPYEISFARVNPEDPESYIPEPIPIPEVEHIHFADVNPPIHQDENVVTMNAQIVSFLDDNEDLEMLADPSLNALGCTPINLDGIITYNVPSYLYEDILTYKDEDLKKYVDELSARTLYGMDDKHPLSCTVFADPTLGDISVYQYFKDFYSDDYMAKTKLLFKAIIEVLLYDIFNWLDTIIQKHDVKAILLNESILLNRICKMNLSHLVDFDIEDEYSYVAIVLNLALMAKMIDYDNKESSNPFFIKLIK
jgi:hypothetical protein